MAYVKRSLEGWKAIIDQRQKSKIKSTRRWCKEKGFPYSSFCAWNRRILNDHQPQQSITKDSFVELEISDSSNTGIKITFKEIQLNLSKDFDSSVFLRCLKVIRSL